MKRVFELASLTCMVLRSCVTKRFLRKPCDMTATNAESTLASHSSSRNANTTSRKGKGELQDKVHTT